MVDICILHESTCPYIFGMWHAFAKQCFCFLEHFLKLTPKITTKGQEIINQPKLSDQELQLF